MNTRPACIICGEPVGPRRRTYCTDKCARLGKRRDADPRANIEFVIRVLTKLPTDKHRAALDPDHIGLLLKLVKIVEDDVVPEVALAAKENGATWAMIGDELGTTGQAANMRWGETYRARREAARP